MSFFGVGIMSDPIDQQIQELHRHLTALTEAPDSTRDQLLILLADINRLLDTPPAAEQTPTEAVESLAVQFDTDHPALSAALRNIIDNLSKAGI
jgi:hypothetical protein